MNLKMWLELRTGIKKVHLFTATWKVCVCNDTEN